MRTNLAIAGVLLAAGMVAAQPSITSLGSGSPMTVTNNLAGTRYIGGTGPDGSGAGGRWALTGGSFTTAVVAGSTGTSRMSDDGQFLITQAANTTPFARIFGNTATGVNPPFSTTPTLVASTTTPPTTDNFAKRWDFGTSTWKDPGGLPIDPALMVYGSGGSGMTPHAISANGRFFGAQSYISSYNNATGTTISASTFNWRPTVWDADANAGAGAHTVLSTPFRTSSNTWRRRTGLVHAVSNDGTVILGSQEHNTSTLPTADPDGSRVLVWRWDGSQYVMSYLPQATDGSGNALSATTTGGAYLMNPAGTIIVGTGFYWDAVNSVNTSGLSRWVWNAGTSTWDGPTLLGTGTTLVAIPSWMPNSQFIACPPGGLPGALANPVNLDAMGMTDDGSVVVGVARYSTCGGFFSAGFIWQQSDNNLRDWYDYLNSLNTPGVAPNGTYGPIGENGDMTKGMPRLGSPFDISPDGTAVVGRVTGQSLIPGATPWLVELAGGTPCVAPSISLQPAASTNYSACSSQIILNVSASGTAPITYQWYKDGNPLSNGVTVTGSTITGADSFQLRVSPPFTAADAGTYYAVATGQCGTPAQTINAVVQIDPAFATPPANDVCSTAQVVTAGTNVIAPAQNLCGAFVMDPAGSSCGSIKTDRWFSFTPAATGSYRLETCGSNFDTVLSVFNACGGSEIACNNDYTIGASTGCTASRSRIDIDLTAATVYYIRIAAPSAAFISTSSTMNLSINPAPARAVNDDCGNASVAVLGANVFSTNEATNDWVPICAPVQSRDVWFRYSPTVRGFLKATTCGVSGSFDTVLSVTESCYSANENACNDDTNVNPCFTQSTVDNIAVVPGTTYYIRVGGAGNPPAFAFGNGTLTLSLRCKSDFNGAGGVSVQDIYDFLADWNSQVTGGPVLLFSADYNSDSVVSVQDIYDFLADWNACIVP